MTILREVMLTKMMSFNQRTFLAECLFQHVEFGEFELSSGGTSSVYVNVKPLLLDSFCLSHIAIHMCGMVPPEVSLIAGIGLSGALLVPAILSASARPMNGLIIRKENKRHGLVTRIEGDSAFKGREIALVDDVLSTGSNLRFASHILKKERNCNTVQWIVFVDRSLGRTISNAPPISTLVDAKEIPGFNDEYKIQTKEEAQTE